MIERLFRNPLALAGAFVLSALLGAAIFAGIQAWLPAASGNRAQVEATVRNYLLTHPEILPEAMEKLQAREAEKAAKVEQEARASLPKHLPALRRPYAGAWAGNPHGDVTVVAFMDYACGYCRASLPAIEQLLRTDPKVRIVYREIPVLGPASGVAARWALAAAEQGKFKAFHEALYAAGPPSTDTISRAAAAAGLDHAAATKAVQSKPVEDEIASNNRLAQAVSLTGTPTWVVGGQLLYGALDYDGLSAAVAQARAGK